MQTKNTKQYWNFLKFINPKSGIKPSPSINEFYEYFKNVNSNPHNDTDINLDQTFLDNSNVHLNKVITQEEILICINKLNNGNASSPSDSIKMNILRVQNLCFYLSMNVFLT
jgi:hypothetical protein